MNTELTDKAADLLRIEGGAEKAALLVFCGMRAEQAIDLVLQQAAEGN